MSAGRWMVVTGVVATRHRSLRDARAEQRANVTLGARLLRYRADRVRWIPRTSLWELRGRP